MRHTGELIIGVSGVLLLIAFGLAFFWVPPAAEFQRLYGNGHIAKIVFVHVPLAIVAFTAFVASAGFGVAFLRTRAARWDALGAATVEVAWLYAVLATATGAWFSRLAWGAWWHWDPRQTTMFMVLLTYTAYLLVREAVDEERRAAVSAVYAILGAVATLLLYWVVPYLPSVQKVSLHPSGIIARGGLDAPYRITLLFSLLGMGLLFVELVRVRAKLASAEKRLVAPL
ncbi:Heme exporter protein C [bacterium HR17]|uniref:Heme exporter protein C n=1 Tax=Candidatus Fervidibacter japonicus TaxID=2035412 RepID=A0A2H5XAL6_9BACT|nr:Heme exporter protein C [bacterium HR17]